MLGEREQHPRSAQHLAGVVAGHRDHGTDSDEQRPDRPEQHRRRIGNRRAVRRQIRQQTLRDHLRERHHAHHRQDRQNERERYMPAWVDRLSRRHRDDVVPAVHENHQQRRRRELAERHRRQRRQGRAVHVAEADDDEEGKRQQLSDRQCVDQPRALADAAHVHPGQRRGDAEEQQRPWPAGGDGLPVVAERHRDAGHHARLTGGAREPLHPSDLERDEPPERRARIEIRSTGALEAAAGFREAQRDGERCEPHQHESDRAPGADLGGHLRRHQKDGAADDLIDPDRGEIPAPERASQREHARPVVS